MSLSNLLEWWNFIFALPLAVGGLLLLGLALSGLIDLSDHHADGDGHATDGDVHHDLADASAHAHADHAPHDASDLHGGGVSHAHDSGHGTLKTLHDSFGEHHDSEKPLWLKCLNLFGIGMGVPLSMAVPLLMMMWGVTGLIVNQMLQPLLRSPTLYVPLSVAIALVVMATTGRLAGLMVRRILSADRPQVVNKYGLIGCSGRAVYTITQEGGVAHVRDRYGNLHRIVCRAVPNEPDIPADTPILVARYDEETHLYWVERNPLELPDDIQQVASGSTQEIGGQTLHGRINDA